MKSKFKNIPIRICDDCWWTMKETTLAYIRGWCSELKEEMKPHPDRISFACLSCHQWLIIPKT